MSSTSYHQFCPVAMAAELLCCRWTLLLVRELMLGSTRFNDLRRGVPKMSSALLALRLRELEAAAIVTRTRPPNGGDAHEYHLTEAGRELRPIVEALGVWGQRWVSTEATLRHLDAKLLMWDIRRNVNVQALPEARTTVEFILHDRPPAERSYWLIVQRGADTDLCMVNPGFDVDLYVATDLRTLTEVWLGYQDLAQASDSGRVLLTGNRKLKTDFRSWLRLSTFAAVEKQALPRIAPMQVRG